MIVYFCKKDPHEAKYQWLLNKRESVGSKYCNGTKAYWILEWYGWYLWKDWWI